MEVTLHQVGAIATNGCMERIPLLDCSQREIGLRIYHAQKTKGPGLSARSFKGLVGSDRFELSTYGLRVRCSTN